MAATPGRWCARSWPRRAALPEDRSGLGDTFAKPFRVANNPFSWSLFEAYGGYPSANDRHVTEFFPERFPHGQYYGLTLGIDAFSVEHIIAWGDEIYADMRAQALGEKPLDQGIFNRTVGEHEQLLAILRSIECDKREVYSMNVPNGGAIPSLPGRRHSGTARGGHGQRPAPSGPARLP